MAQWPLRMSSKELPMPPPPPSFSGLTSFVNAYFTITIPLLLTHNYNIIITFEALLTDSGSSTTTLTPVTAFSDFKVDSNCSTHVIIIISLAATLFVVLIILAVVLLLLQRKQQQKGNCFVVILFTFSLKFHMLCTLSLYEGSTHPKGPVKRQTEFEVLHYKWGGGGGGSTIPNYFSGFYGVRH